MKSVPLTIGAVLQSGTDLLATGDLWPVTNAQFLRMSNEVFDAYTATVVQLKQTNEFDAIVADSRFVSFLVQFWHYQWVLGLGSKERVNLLVPDDGIWNQDWTTHKHYFSTQVEGIRHTRVKLRTCFYDYSSHRSKGFKSIWDSFSGNSEHWYLGGLNDRRHLVDCVQDCGETSLSHWDWDGILDRVLPFSWTPRNERRRSIIEDQFLRPFFQKLEQAEGWQYIEPLQQLLFDVWSTRLSQASAICDKIYSSAEHPKSLFVLGANNPMRKLLTLAYQRCGTVVLGFHHGDALDGIYQQKYTSRLQFCHAKHFVLPSENMVGWYQQTYGQDPIGQAVGQRFSFVRSKEMMGKIDRANLDSPKEGARDKTVLIGFPMNTVRYPDDPSLFFYPKLRLELAIARSCERTNTRLIYQPHPDRIGVVQKIIGNKVYRIWSGPIEQREHEIKTIIFSHPTTSVLGYFLFSGANIIIFDSGNVSWEPTMRELLEKRCHLISIKNYLGGHSGFPEAQFLEALQSADDRRANSEFLEAYFGSTTDRPTDLDLSIWD
jgi:hypothetical protein